MWLPNGSRMPEVGAVGLLDRLLGDLDAGVAQRLVRRVDVVAGEEDAAEGALGEQVAELGGGLGVLLRAARQLEQQLRVLLPGQPDR